MNDNDTTLTSDGETPPRADKLLEFLNMRSAVAPLGPHVGEAD